MRKNFAQSLAWVLDAEGGNDDDPADHGGRTSRGITQREYDAWRWENKLPKQDVWKASQPEITQIYQEEYWMPLCDTLPTGMDYCYFNMCVNAGPQRATKLLQRAVGCAADGRIGPITRSAINVSDPATVVARFADLSRDFYLSLHQPRFIKGWLNRVSAVKANALQMIRREAVA